MACQRLKQRRRRGGRDGGGQLRGEGAPPRGGTARCRGGPSVRRTTSCSRSRTPRSVNSFARSRWAGRSPLGGETITYAPASAPASRTGAIRRRSAPDSRRRFTARPWRGTRRRSRSRSGHRATASGRRRRMRLTLARGSRAAYASPNSAETMGRARPKRPAPATRARRAPSRARPSAAHRSGGGAAAVPAASPDRTAPRRWRAPNRSSRRPGTEPRRSLRASIDLVIEPITSSPIIGVRISRTSRGHWKPSSSGSASISTSRSHAPWSAGRQEQPDRASQAVADELHLLQSELSQEALDKRRQPRRRDSPDGRPCPSVQTRSGRGRSHRSAPGTGPSRPSWSGRRGGQSAVARPRPRVAASR